MSDQLLMPREFKPCPFCGSTEIMDMQYDCDFWVQCAGCNSTSQVYETEVESLKAWNTRAQPADCEPKPVCMTCGDNGFVADGFQTHSDGGIEYENGPIECVKDCPTCTRPAPAGVVLPERREYDIGMTTKYGEGWNACREETARLNGVKP